MSKVTKILLLIDDFGGPEGGTEQHLLFLQRELPQDVFALHVAALTRIEGVPPSDFRVRPLVFGDAATGRRHGLHRLRQLIALIGTAQIDVVHAFCRRSELLAIFACKRARRGKVLGVRRNLGYWHTWRSLWTARAIGKLGAQYVANCEAARRFATEVEWIAPERICVIPNAVQSKRLEEGLADLWPRARLGVTAGDELVGMVSSVRPVKDHATFLRAAKIILSARPRARFVIVGWEEPGCSEEMKELARVLEIDGRVSWLGMVPNPAAIMPHFDVAVLSSRSEAMSNALLEYAAAGVATVATDVGAARDIVQDGETGLLVPPQSPELLADRICQLLSDGRLRSEMGRTARRRTMARFSESAVLDQYSVCYRRLANQAAPNSGAENLARSAAPAAKAYECHCSD